MIMCGIRESNRVNKSILTTSCENAMASCSNVNCVRDYVRDNFNNRRYKFCPNRMNMLVTAGDWAKWAYGFEYVSGKYDCMAYCVP